MAEAASKCQTSGKPRESFEDYFKAASSNDSQNFTERFEKKLAGDKTVNSEIASNSDLKVTEEKSSKLPTAKDNRKKKEPRKKSRAKSEKSTVDKKSTKKTAGESKETLRQSTITSHFPVRRSNRRCKSVIQIEKDKVILQKLLDEDESGLEVRVLPDKGRSVFAVREFKRGDLICEYAGELVDYSLGKKRELEYSQNPELGCYSYFFQYKSRRYCVDATKETSRLGRLLNHSKTQNNVCTRVFPVKDIPRLILVASRDIEAGEELLYDYGERNKAAIDSHPWLQQ